MSAAGFPQAPIVDIGALYGTDGDAYARAQTALVDAVASSGVFVAVGMPDSERLDERANFLLRFFELSDKQRDSLSIKRSDPNSDRMYRGYYSTPARHRFSHLQYFDIGPDRNLAVPDLLDAHMFLERNVWPVDEPAHGWRAAMLAHYAMLEQLGQTVLYALADAMRIDLSALKSRFDHGNSTMRLLRYPTRPADTPVDTTPGKATLGRDPNEEAMAIGRHTDGCGLSLLWQRDCGLQGQASDGTWFDVPATDNGVSVHIGDVVDSLTEGRIPATPHRVFNQPTERRSLGFFLEPTLVANCAPIGPDSLDSTEPMASPDSRSRPESGYRREELDSYCALLLRRHARYPGYEGIIRDPDTHPISQQPN